MIIDDAQQIIYEAIIPHFRTEHTDDAPEAAQAAADALYRAGLLNRSEQ